MPPRPLEPSYSPAIFRRQHGGRLVTAVELDTDMWERPLMAMLAGEQPKSPFPTDELKEELPSWGTGHRSTGRYRLQMWRT